ncbi:hypothetical protein G6F50_014573 [Rhizopus delemar]|uniref:Uncharacterized protein n=1 Tax=Rhizopus delemar TaxID=936053 RepID=A0A9P6Y436_9FUNG|nr:hypothetical protein G6F50_014573 [Rhizopus delemar]
MDMAAPPTQWGEDAALQGAGVGHAPLAGGVVDAGVGDDGMDLVQQGDAVQADAAELGGIGQHHDAARALDHAVVEAGFGFVVGGQAELQVQAIHAQEQGVEAVRVEAGFGLAALQRQRLLAQQSAGQQHVDAGCIGQFPGDVQAVGHHRDVALCAQVAGQGHRGRTGVDDDVVAGAHQACGAGAD